MTLLIPPSLAPHPLTSHTIIVDLPLRAPDSGPRRVPEPPGREAEGAAEWELQATQYCVVISRGLPQPPLLQEALPDFCLDGALLPPSRFIPFIVLKRRRGNKK